MSQITNSQKRALVNLRRNGYLAVSPDGVNFCAEYFDGCEKHGPADIQQLVSDGFAKPLDFINTNFGFPVFTKIIKV
jgi:hypothetical protein